MIFCSRRVFLNVLTQYMDLNSLLNANYFLVDQTRPSVGYAFMEEPVLNQVGEMTFGVPQLEFPQSQTKAAQMHKYFISYSTVFETSPFFSVLAASVRNDYSTPVEKFVHHLQSTDTQIAVYEAIFNVELQGNGLQILIMKDDIGCEMFGHIICSYLSEIFGADVTFVDPQYRPNTHGQLHYVGNKQFAEQHIRELRDIRLQWHIQAMIDTAGYGSGLSNLTQFLTSTDMGMEELFHVYNVLFPNAPLPPGNYTKQHLIHIITGRIADSTGRAQEVTQLQNLGTSFYAFDQMIGDYNDAIEEDFSSVQ